MYKCLSKNVFEDQEGYRIVPLRREDIEIIRIWRNEQQDLLRQKGTITTQDQVNYFNSQVAPAFEFLQPKQILFSFLYKNVCIGYGGLTHCDWEDGRAEVAFLIDPQRTLDFLSYQRDFHHFLFLLCEATFNSLNFHRLFTETFAFRHEHINVLESFGFQREGILRDHIFKKQQWFDSYIHGLLRDEAPV